MVNVETVRKIISVYMPELTTEFNIRTLSEKADISYDSTYRHVNTLAEKRILKRRKVGNSTVCRLNLEEIRTMKYLEEISISKRDEFIRENPPLENLLNELTEKLKDKIRDKLHCIVLFGSHAKGTQNKESDLDLLIIASSFEAEQRINQEYGELEHRYGIDISPLITTPTEFVKMLKSEERKVGDEVQRDGIVLYGFEKYYLYLTESIN